MGHFWSFWLDFSVFAGLIQFVNILYRIAPRYNLIHQRFKSFKQQQFFILFLLKNIKIICFWRFLYQKMNQNIGILEFSRSRLFFILDPIFLSLADFVVFRELWKIDFLFIFDPTQVIFLYFQSKITCLFFNGIFIFPWKI